MYVNVYVRNTYVPAILSWFNNHAGGYADTPGNEPTQSRCSLENFY